jgi:iron(III) transport system substrate-binding protein
MTLLRASLFAAATLFPLNALADITLYSGRGEQLVAPLIAAFTAETGIRVNVRYAGTAELAILLQEEGVQSPADVFWSQDPSAMGAVAGLMTQLPAAITDRVPASYRGADGRWVATSGRGRVMAISTERVAPETVPASLLDLTAPEWNGRLVWAPTNGALHAHITAMRVQLGDDVTRDWLAGIRDNNPVAARNNTAVVQAVLDGEGDIGITNNYYIGRALARDAAAPVAQALFAQGDIGNLLLVAAAGVLESSSNKDESLRFVEFLLSPAAQQYVVSEIQEFEVVPGAAIQAGRMLTLDQVIEAAPAVDLNTLGDLEGTLQMMRDLGIL